MGQHIAEGMLVSVLVETSGSQAQVPVEHGLAFKLAPETSGTVLEVSEDGSRIRFFCLHGALWVDKKALEG